MSLPRKSCGRLIRRFLIIGGVTVGAFYLLILGLSMWLEGLLIYPTWQIPSGDWEPTDFTYRDVSFPSADGTSLHGWYFEHDQPVAHVLYCHGNGENVAHLGSYMDELREKYHISLFAFDYRGYGRSQGRPAEPGIIADGLAAQQWLAKEAGIDEDRIVLWGRSIGGAIAVQVAAQQGARGLILERTFSRLTDVAAHHYPWLPVRSLLRNRYDSLAHIRTFRGPLLQSHGTDDEVVPFELGKQLFEASQAEPKRFVAIQGGTHNGPSSKEYYTELREFLESIP
jgi:fermentation-respiration switch protein FrsA (DUF1100 family)